MPDSNWCTKEHAQKQAEMIRAYWQKQNVAVTVWIEEVMTSKRGSMFNVRSDIKLGAVRP
jgi:hypothetical protein